MTPHLILHPPQTPMTPDNLPLPLLLYTLLSSLSWLYIVLFTMSNVWPFNNKFPQGNHMRSFVSALWSHTSTVFLASDSFFHLIVFGEWFCFFHVDKNCFRVFLDLNPYHFASKVCFCIFDVSSFTAFGRLSLFLHRIVDIMICSCQSCMFRLARNVWRLGSYLGPSNWNSLPVSLEYEDGDYHNAWDTIIYAHAMHHSLVFGAI